VPLATPTLFMFADYNCQQVPICDPEVYETAPDADGPGNKGDDFQLLQQAGVDTMQVPLRAALHLDWVPSQPWRRRFCRFGTSPTSRTCSPSTTAGPARSPSNAARAGLPAVSLTRGGSSEASLPGCLRCPR
jgi:hypothetical protein